MIRKIVSISCHAGMTCVISRVGREGTTNLCGLYRTVLQSNTKISLM